MWVIIGFDRWFTWVISGFDKWFTWVIIGLVLDEGFPNERFDCEDDVKENEMQSESKLKRENIERSRQTLTYNHFDLSPIPAFPYSTNNRILLFSLHTLPTHHLARLQRHHHRISELVALRHLPLPSLQLHELLIPRQSIKVRSVLSTPHSLAPFPRRERLQLLQTPVRLEDFRVQLQAQKLAEAPSARLLAFLRFSHVRRGVGSQKQSLAARLNRADQRLAMLLALQDGEAVEVGLETADEELYSLVKKKKKDGSDCTSDAEV